MHPGAGGDDHDERGDQERDGHGSTSGVDNAPVRRSDSRTAGNQVHNGRIGLPAAGHRRRPGPAAGPTGSPGSCGWRSPTGGCRWAAGCPRPGCSPPTSACPGAWSPRRTSGWSRTATSRAAVAPAPSSSPRRPRRPPTAHQPSPAATSVFAADPADRPSSTRTRGTGPDRPVARRTRPGRVPAPAWLRAERAVLRPLAPADFGYGDPRGTPALRGAVAAWLARSRGIRGRPRRGDRRGRRLAGTRAARPGAAARTASTRSRWRTRARSASASTCRTGALDTPPVPVDEAGLRVDELDAAGARAVMLTPAHQFPTGVVLDGERRRQLVALGPRRRPGDRGRLRRRAPVRPAAGAGAAVGAAGAGLLRRQRLEAARAGAAGRLGAGAVPVPPARWSRPSGTPTSATPRCRSWCWPS